MSVTSSAFGANNLSARSDLQEIVQRVERETRAPTTNDKLYAVGTSWIDITGARAYTLVGVAKGDANWQQSAGA